MCVRASTVSPERERVLYRQSEACLRARDVVRAAGERERERVSESECVREKEKRYYFSRAPPACEPEMCARE